MKTLSIDTAAALISVTQGLDLENALPTGAQGVARRRLGSVGTNSLGAFEIRHDQAGRDSAGARLPWNLVVTVAGP